MTDKSTAKTDTKATSKSDGEGDTVLVPPAGVHTPGRTAMGGEDGGGAPYVEAPADAASDPEAAQAAYEKVQRGEHDVELPRGVIPQHPDGSAMTPAEAGEALEDEREQQAYVEGKGKAPEPKR